MSVLVIDYGMGNLASVEAALEACGAAVTVTTDPDAIASAERVVLPGVGSFADAMRNLREAGWDRAIREAVAERRLPLLGICLGMQLLATTGEEGGRAEGLGLIPGHVTRLEPADARERIPHVGWNEVELRASTPLFEGLADDTDFYFVHSFHFVPERAELVHGWTPYCGGFASVVASGSVIGCQFHPEKSSAAGRRLLANFLRASPC